MTPWENGSLLYEMFRPSRQTFFEPSKVTGSMKPSQRIVAPLAVTLTFLRLRMSSPVT